MRYPNATEMGNSGVGDTPYFVKPNNYVNISTLTRQEAKDHWTQINAQYANNTDRYPLMQPFIIAPSTTELFLTTLVTVSIASVVVFAVFLFHFKKRKH